MRKLQTILGLYNHILGLGLQKSNYESMHFHLHINAWSAGDDYQVSGVTFGSDMVDGNTQNKNDKRSRNCKWFIWSQIVPIKILKTGQIISFSESTFTSITPKKELQHPCVTVHQQCQSPPGQAGSLRSPLLHHLTKWGWVWSSNFSARQIIHPTCIYSACTYNVSRSVPCAWDMVVNEIKTSLWRNIHWSGRNQQ